jgi:DNA-binding winged helix-turn-helix (wHTH) protein
LDVLCFKLGARGAEVLRDGCGFVESEPGVSVRFGRFVFDEARRELTSDGRRVPLSPKAFELLAVLLRERPRALSKADLRDRLWPETFVGETSLPRVVGEVRRALDDRPGEGRLVRTAQRFGYSFVGEVVENERSARPDAAAGGPETGCAILWGERLFPLVLGENLVGRDPGCTLTIPSDLVSRRHARIIVTGERATVMDLGSKNGTLLGGRRLERESKLADGDEIRIGPALLVFCASGAGSTRTGRSTSSSRR